MLCKFKMNRIEVGCLPPDGTPLRGVLTAGGENMNQAVNFGGRNVPSGIKMTTPISQAKPRADVDISSARAKQFQASVHDVLNYKGSGEKQNMYQNMKLSERLELIVDSKLGGSVQKGPNQFENQYGALLKTPVEENTRSNSGLMNDTARISFELDNISKSIKDQLAIDKQIPPYTDFVPFVKQALTDKENKESIQGSNQTSKRQNVSPRVHASKDKIAKFRQSNREFNSDLMRTLEAQHTDRKLKEAEEAIERE